MEFDEVLEQVGEIGLYQILLILNVCAMELMAADAIHMNFMGFRNPHWCKAPALVNFSHAEQRYIAIPDDNSCEQFPLDWNNYTDEELLSWDREERTGNLSDYVRCGDGYMFDRGTFAETVRTKWDLVCDKDWQVPLISTIYMAGRLIGAFSCGPVSDRFGRKITTLGFHVIKVVGGIMSAFIPYYAGFILGRFFMAVGSTGSNLAAYVLVTETCGKRYRGVFGAVWNGVFSVGSCVVPGVAYFVRDFVRLQHVYTWPNLVLLLFVFSIDESPRWLMSQGRDKEAFKVITRIAAVNGRSIPQTNTISMEKKEDENSKVEKGSIPDLFRLPKMRKMTLIICLSWFTNSLLFYGLSLNSGRLPGDVFINTLLLSAVEIPANLLVIVFLNVLGRRGTVGGFMLLGGVFTVFCIPFLIHTHLETGATVFSILGKAAITISFTGVYVLTSELVPTSIRNIGVGTASMCARISGMAAPYVGGPLSDVRRYLPSIIFSALAVLSGLLVFLLPETRGQKLPDTVQEAEDFGQSKRNRKVAIVPLPLDGAHTETADNPQAVQG